MTSEDMDMKFKSWEDCNKSNYNDSETTKPSEFIAVNCEYVIKNEALTNGLGDEELCPYELHTESEQDFGPTNKDQSQIRSVSSQDFPQLDSYITHICPFCGIEFESLKTWTSHVSRVHQVDKQVKINFKFLNKDQAQCNECQLIFKIVQNRKDALKKHLIRHQLYKNYEKCKLCDCKKSDIFTMRRHIKITHGNVIGGGQSVSAVGENQASETYCAFCKEYIKDASSLSLHMRNAHSSLCRDKIRYVCPCCGKQFDTEKFWRKHLQREHSFTTLEGYLFEKLQNDKTRARCTKCKIEMQYSCNSDLYKIKLHALAHLPYKCYKCRYCNYDHEKKCQILLHSCNELLATLESIPEIVYRKAQCKRRERIERADDETDKLFICPSCGQEFVEMELWQEHLTQVHEFNKIESLNISIMKDKLGAAAKQLKYYCTICNKIFQSNNTRNLKAHAFQHMPFKMYKCLLCNATLNTIKMCFCKDKLTLSKIITLCPKCDESFTTEETWCAHIQEKHATAFDDENLKLIQIDDLTYKCEVCEQQMKMPNMAAMFLHATEHMTKKCIECCVCGKCFINKSEFIAHYAICRSSKKLKIKSPVDVLTDFEKNWQSFCKFVKMQCPICGIQSEYKGDVELQQHLLSVHHLEMDRIDKLNFMKSINTNGEENYKCLQCECELNTNTSISQLQEHKLGHFSHKIWICTFCVKEYNFKEQILEHIIEKHMKNKRWYDVSHLLDFYCPICKAEFQLMSEWKLHLNNKHGLNTLEGRRLRKCGDNKLQCLVCSQTIKETPKVLQHCFSHLPYNVYKCRFCKRGYKTYENAIKDAKKCQEIDKNRSKESTEEIMCNEAESYEKYSDASSDFNIKEEIVTESNDRKTPIVDQNPFGETDKAISENLNNEKYSGASLDVNVKEETVTESIERVTPITGQQPFDLALYEPDDPLQLEDSVAAVSCTRMATCSEKSRTFNKFQQYMTYACPACNMPFATQMEWHTHINTKHDFFEEHSLHFESIPHEKLKSSCKDCGTVVKGGTLQKQRHKLVHMPYTAFVCTICFHRSRTQTVLIQHLRGAHFKRGEFKCGICALMFSTFYERYAHAKSQHPDTNEWPDNVCRICVRIIANVAPMKRHMETHDYDRLIYPCGVCTHTFFHPRDRKRHWLQKHPLQYAELEKDEGEVNGDESLFHNKRKQSTGTNEMKSADVDISLENTSIAFNIKVKPELEDIRSPDNIKCIETTIPKQSSRKNIAKATVSKSKSKTKKQMHQEKPNFNMDESIDQMQKNVNDNVEAVDAKSFMISCIKTEPEQLVDQHFLDQEKPLTTNKCEMTVESTFIESVDIKVENKYATSNEVQPKKRIQSEISTSGIKIETHCDEDSDYTPLSKVLKTLDEN